MSLLIKALDKAQEAKAQEAKARDTKPQNTNVQDSNEQIDQRLEASRDPATKRKSKQLASAGEKSTFNAASAELAAANALEMELSPIAYRSIADKRLDQAIDDQHIQSNPDIFSSTNATSSSNASNYKSQNTAADKAFAISDQAATNKASAKNAANVFAAKRIESNHRNTILAIIAGVSVSAMLAVAAYFYLFLERTPQFLPHSIPNTSADSSLNISTDVSSVNPINTSPETPVTTALPQTADTQITNTQMPASQPLAETPIAIPSATKSQSATQQNEPAMQVQQPINNAPKSVFRDESLDEDERTLNQMLVEKTPNNRAALLKRNQLSRGDGSTVGAVQIASKSASIEVSKTRPQMGVNPILMQAFNAYNAGNDAVASKLYRQVLQRDIRNVDALLGLGAIAQRQGRMADANGWYAKVLEVEPRNMLATSAVLNSQPPSDSPNNESRIKNMLANQPDDANLHATLGNFYADLNQWPAAQQAYFDAFSLNASADNAFNLAVSLDQLGKPKLALPYYQQALQLAQSGNSSIDKNALIARIAAIQ